MVLHPIRVPDAIARSREHARAHARDCLRAVLGWHIGRPVADVDLVANEHGKPALRGAELQFNQSHSAGWLYVAVSDSAVGVDVEQRRARPSATFKRYLEQCCGVVPGAEPEQGLDTIQTWSRLEALTKCAGMGMTVPLDGCEVPVSALPCPVPVGTPFGSFWLADLPAPAGFSASAAFAAQPARWRVVAPQAVWRQLACQPQAPSIDWIDDDPSARLIKTCSSAAARSSWQASIQG